MRRRSSSASRAAEEGEEEDWVGDGERPPRREARPGSVPLKVPVSGDAVGELFDGFRVTKRVKALSDEDDDGAVVSFCRRWCSDWTSVSRRFWSCCEATRQGHQQSPRRNDSARACSVD